jgi:hypothetical protein
MQIPGVVLVQKKKEPPYFTTTRSVKPRGGREAKHYHLLTPIPPIDWWFEDKNVELWQLIWLIVDVNLGHKYNLLI